MAEGSGFELLVPFLACLGFPRHHPELRVKSPASKAFCQLFGGIGWRVRSTWKGMTQPLWSTQARSDASRAGNRLSRYASEKAMIVHKVRMTVF
jgi:hypothetical protein